MAIQNYPDTNPYPMNLPPKRNVHPATLGKTVVEHLTDTAHHQALGEMYPAQAAAYNHIADESFKATDFMLQTTRVKISNLSKRQTPILERYCSVDVPDAISAHKSSKEKELGKNYAWQEWLSEGTNDLELRAFLEWHVGHIEEQQIDPNVQAEIEAQKELYKDRLQQAVNDGWLHPNATEAIDKVDGVKVFVGDVFDTLMQERGGYHERGSNEIVIASAIDDYENMIIDEPGLIENIRKHTDHELNHAVLGKLGARWLDEALTEHIAVSLDFGRPEIVDPSERPGGKGTYIHERKLLDLLLNEGRQKIPPNLATKAYSDKTSESAEVFGAAVTEAWGEYMDPADKEKNGALGAITRHILRMEDIFMAEERDRPVDQRSTQLAIRQMAVIHAFEELNDPESRAGVFAAEEPDEPRLQLITSS
jgi:hypothetical protein